MTATFILLIQKLNNIKCHYNIIIMSTQFWIYQPTILFDKTQAMKFYPISDMTYEEKLNALTRFVIIVTILGFIFSQSFNQIIIGFLTISILIALYFYRKNKIIEEKKNKNKTEGFNNLSNSNSNSNSDSDSNLSIELKQLLKEQYYNINKNNPFGNVLLTEINSNPDRPAAPPSFNPQVVDKINSSVKKQTQMLNSSINNTNKQIYGDLYENYNLDNSMMRFHTTANSRVTNDQGAFAQWLYGNMPSAKEDNIEGNIQRVKDNLRYNLY